MKYTRRQFVVASAAASSSVFILGAKVIPDQNRLVGRAPWYQGCTRWGQTNTSEQDVAIYDVSFWRGQWRRVGVQVILANACAGFATFPSRNPLVASSRFAPQRDLLGEINDAARADNIFVVARMDSGVLNQQLLEKFSDWRTRTLDGKPGLVMCINSPYREEYVYGLYREVIERYGVVGFADNGGIGGSRLCYCNRCANRYRKDVGKALPTSSSLDDADYRQWCRWNTALVMEMWEKTNAATRQMGGPDCEYLGMVRKFSPFNREVATRAKLLLMDCQSRNDSASFQEHVDEGRYMHSILGWDKNVQVASSMTQHSHGYFRVTADPAAELQLYMTAGIAGGFNPWDHYPTAYSSDRRAYSAPIPLCHWHRKYTEYFANRIPVATAGIVRSDDNAVFFGRDAPPFYQPGLISAVTQVPYRGMVRALFQSRIPYFPVDIKDIVRHTPLFSVLVLPNVGGMSDEECEDVRQFVERGGSLLATGMTSLYDENGEARTDFGLSRVFGTHIVGSAPVRTFFSVASVASYLKLYPTRVFGETADVITSEGAATRHPALIGFEDTNVIGYGGGAVALQVDADRTVLSCFIPPSRLGDGEAPMWQSEPLMPALIVGQYGLGRVAYLPVDLDRRYGTDPNPDHALLLGNLLKWCAGDTLPFEIDGPGDVGAYLYRQSNRFVMHIVNGSGIDNGDEIAEQYFPTGPLRIRVKSPFGTKSDVIRLKEAGILSVPSRLRAGTIEFEIKRLVDHEVIVIG